MPALKVKFGDLVMRAWHGLSPQALFVTSFAVQIAVGTAGLLLLPGLYTAGGLSVVDALFTITSATCVTGLAVVDTATHFSFWGQAWILIFIQVGGLSVVTIATLIAAMLGRRVSLRSEVVAIATHQAGPRGNLLQLLGRLAVFTFGFELIVALVLWVQWIPLFGAVDAAWHAVFQAVSAFCNAGFSTFSDSLTSFSHSPGVLLPISLLVIIGGFGFLAAVELWQWLQRGGLSGPNRISTHTYAALVTTLALLAGGTVVYAALEWGGVLEPLSVTDKVLNAWFMAATPRTAGFNTVPYDQISSPTAFFTVLLMAIGGSPGSTAGGFKTTAFAVMLAMAWARLRSRRYVSLHDRTVPDATVQRTASLVILFFVLVTSAVLVLTLTEARGLPREASHNAFLPLLFEVVSAAGTVGLSMGVTAGLSTFGKLVIIAVMFIGRVGPLAFFAAMTLRTSASPPGFRPAHEDVVIG